MILIIAEIKKINRPQLEASERKKERKKERKTKQKQKGCFNSMFNGRRGMVVSLGGISVNKMPGLASSLLAPCRPCSNFVFIVTAVYLRNVHSNERKQSLSAYRLNHSSSGKVFKIFTPI